MQPVRSKPLVLSDTQRLILSMLVRLRFATASQLMYWLGVDHASSVTRPCSQLLKAGILETHKELKPYVFRLSRKGSRMMSVGYDRNWYSLSALQQYVLKNEVEIQLRSRFEKTRAIPREKLLTIGLNPAIAEHGYRSGDQLIFVIIDDYLMESKRINHCLSRIHKPNSKYYDVEQGTEISWKGYADRCIVYCCDEGKLQEHKKLVAKLRLSVECLYIDPIWGIAS